MNWLTKVLTLGWVLTSFAGCDNGNEEVPACDDGNVCTKDTFVDGECSHETTDFVSEEDDCTFHPEYCVNATNYRWRPEKEVKLDCAWLSQLSDADDHNLTCGRTSLVMATACIDGYTPEYSEVLALIEWMKEFIPHYPKIGQTGTYPYQIEDTSAGYYGLPAQSFEFSIGEYQNGMVDEVTLKDIYEDLQRGLPVMVLVHGQNTCNLTDVMKKHSDYFHFELLVGMTPTHVILNDPGVYDITLGRKRYYTIESFLTVWMGGVRFNPRRL